MVMKKKETCHFCSRVILLDKDKYVLVGTYRKDEILEEMYYHFKCWEANWSKKVNDAIMQRAKVGMKGLNQVMKLMSNQNKEDIGGDEEIIIQNVK